MTVQSYSFFFGIKKNREREPIFKKNFIFKKKKKEKKKIKKVFFFLIL
jgi:hypothetical protein